MKISIIIPTYKPQSYLWECLSSLSNQTFPKEDYEILLVLNGCENPYKLEIESFISKRSSNVNIQLIHTLDAGVSNARNIALSYVKGEYVTFIDDDDFVSPLFLLIISWYSAQITGVGSPFVVAISIAGVST